MGVIAKYIKEKAKEKKKSPVEWMQNILSHSSDYLIATHTAKFTHPSISYRTSFYDTSQPIGAGYLSTADTSRSKDFLASSGSYIPLGVFLAKKFSMDDGQSSVSIFDLFRMDSVRLKEELSSVGIAYEEVKSRILSIPKAPIPTASSTFLKQVYFPVGNQTYHLLSILPPSSLLVSMKEKLLQDETKRIQSLKKDSDNFGQSYRDIQNLIGICFGGNKPHNISTLNQLEHSFYALPAIPPSLSDDYICIPKGTSFFYSLPRKEFYADFNALQKLFLQRQKAGNGMPNRSFLSYRDSRLYSIIDRILFYAGSLQSKPAGWSNISHLNDANRLWLDKRFVDSRREDDSWQKEIAHEFARWFGFTYEAVAKHHHRKNIYLGDPELHFFSSVLEKTLKEVESSVTHD